MINLSYVALSQGAADTWATVLLRYRPNEMTRPVGVAKIGDWSWLWARREQAAPRASQ